MKIFLLYLLPWIFRPTHSDVRKVVLVSWTSLSQSLFTFTLFSLPHFPSIHFLHSFCFTFLDFPSLFFTSRHSLFFLFLTLFVCVTFVSLISFHFVFLYLLFTFLWFLLLPCSSLYINLFPLTLLHIFSFLYLSVLL